jgi:hypothetical protein
MIALHWLNAMLPSLAVGMAMIRAYMPNGSE